MVAESEEETVQILAEVKSSDIPDYGVNILVATRNRTEAPYVLHGETLGNTTELTR